MVLLCAVAFACQLDTVTESGEQQPAVSVKPLSKMLKVKNKK